MRACLMKVNYDPRYTMPHQITPLETLDKRLNLTREIYGAPQERRSSQKEIKVKLDDLDRGTQAQSKPRGQQTYNKTVQKSTPELALKYHPDKQMGNSGSPGKESPNSPVTGKSERHRDGVARAHASIRLQPLVQRNSNHKSTKTVEKRSSSVSGTQSGPVIENEENSSKKSKSKVKFTVADKSSQGKTEGVKKASFPERAYKRHPIRTSLSMFNGNKPLYSPPKSTETFRNARSMDEGMLMYTRSRTMPPQSLDRPKIKTAGSLEMERRARVAAEKAIRDRKVFTIVGPYHSLRLALRKRGWVERFHNAPLPSEATYTDDDSKKENTLPPWQEEQGLYGIMSHMVRNCTPAFLFTVKTNDVDSRIIKNGQIINHFGKAKAFTTKMGLCENIRNVPWFAREDPDTFFPRCFKLDNQEEIDAFVDNFRLTACISMVKCFVERYKGKEKEANATSSGTPRPDSSTSQNKPSSRSTTFLEDPGHTSSVFMKQTKDKPSAISVSVHPPSEDLSDGKTEVVTPRVRLKKGGIVNIRALEIAVEQCENYLRIRKHEDLDSFVDPKRLGSEMWEQFLMMFYQFVHDGASMSVVTEQMVTTCEELLNKVKDMHSQFSMDGDRNIWILKPGAKSRGRGITLLDRLDCILKAVAGGDGPFVVQKYIERPLLIHNTKFDIRQWFLVTDWNPLTVWFYKDCYLRFCSQQFTLNDFHISIHLSNNCVQKNFKNGQRASDLPEENMWTSDDFNTYLRAQGHGSVYDDKIVPAMKQALLCALLTSQEHVEVRKSAFELYGADFMITEDLQPWLIEINSSPSMSRNTKISKHMVDAVSEDMIRVVLDRRSDKQCDLGRFELLYRQPMVQDVLLMDQSLAVCGKKIKKLHIHR